MPKNDLLGFSFDDSSMLELELVLLFLTNGIVVVGSDGGKCIGVVFGDSSNLISMFHAFWKKFDAKFSKVFVEHLELVGLLKTSL